VSSREDIHSEWTKYESEWNDLRIRFRGRREISKRAARSPTRCLPSPLPSGEGERREGGCMRAQVAQAAGDGRARSAISCGLIRRLV